MTENNYYDVNKLLSYNRFINMVVSERGLGKTYGVTKYVVNRFLKYGEQFVYVRRYKTDMGDIDKFFDDMIKYDEFPNHDFAVNGKRFIIDGHVAGFAIPLSAQASKKSVAYPDVTTILFDEFLTMSSDSRYLPDEPSKLLSLIESIVRRRTNWHAILLANAITVANPYFLYFDIQPNMNKEFTTNPNNPEVLIQIPRNKNYRDERMKSRWGRLVGGTPYGEFAIQNKFAEDTNDFIEQRSKDSRLICVLEYHDTAIGFWTDVQAGKIYASETIDPLFKRIVLTTKDHKDNRLLIDNYRKNSRLNYILKAFKKGYLYFENQKVKHKALQVFRKFNIR